MRFFLQLNWLSIYQYFMMMMIIVNIFKSFDNCRHFFFVVLFFFLFNLWFTHLHNQFFFVVVAFSNHQFYMAMNNIHTHTHTILCHHRFRFGSLNHISCYIYSETGNWKLSLWGFFSFFFTTIIIIITLYMYKYLKNNKIHSFIPFLFSLNVNMLKIL